MKSNQVEIKPASLLHIDKILPLFSSYAKFSNIVRDEESYREFLTQQINSENTLILVAFIEQKAVAFLQVFKVHSTLAMKQSWLLNDLFVDIQYRRIKIATKLIQFLFEFAQANKVFSVKLTTEKTNFAAISLYQSQSFEQIDSHYIFSKKVN